MSQLVNIAIAAYIKKFVCEVKHMTTLDIILLCIAAFVVLCCGIIFLIKFLKKTPEEKRELLVQWLTGVVLKAEQAFTESKKGAEKLQMVEEEFKANAPIFYKLILKTTKTANLQELIEEALQKLKESNFHE